MESSTAMKLYNSVSNEQKFGQEEVIGVFDYAKMEFSNHSKISHINITDLIYKLEDAVLEKTPDSFLQYVETHEQGFSLIEELSKVVEAWKNGEDPSFWWA